VRIGLIAFGGERHALLAIVLGGERSDLVAHPSPLRHDLLVSPSLLMLI
jgi:hypothetical protein